ncbi:hypothetical protein R6Q57_000408 [Mikania cordata]
MLIENQKVSNDMEACMTKLGTMRWDESDVKYQTALLLFGESADIRKAWLQLQPQTYIFLDFEKTIVYFPISKVNCLTSFRIHDDT